VRLLNSATLGVFAGKLDGTHVVRSKLVKSTPLSARLLLVHLRQGDAVRDTLARIREHRVQLRHCFTPVARVHVEVFELVPNASCVPIAREDCTQRLKASSRSRRKSAQGEGTGCQNVGSNGGVGRKHEPSLASHSRHHDLVRGRLPLVAAVASSTLLDRLISAPAAREERREQ
jgi:hypothetical protein